MTKDEALKMAIEALELVNEHAFRCGLAQDAIKACKEALTQPSNMVTVPLDKLQEMQRRLKALDKMSDNSKELGLQMGTKDEAFRQFMKENKPLYVWNDNITKAFNAGWQSALAQPQKQWVSLSDDEIEAIMIGKNGTYFNFARAIEAKLKELNT